MLGRFIKYEELMQIGDQMLFRYKIEWEFEADSIPAAKTIIDSGTLGFSEMIVQSLEAIHPDDRIILKKFKLPPKTEPMVSYPDAIKDGLQPENDQLEHSRDASLGISPRPSDSSLLKQSEGDEENSPF